MENTSNDLPKGLVATFRDELSVQRAATALRSIGVAEADIHAGGSTTGPESHRSQLDPLASDQAVNVDPEEVAATGVASMVVAGAVGALIALPFAFIAFGDWPFWLRAIVVCLAGALAAAAYGTVMAVPILTPPGLRVASERP